MAFYGTAHAQKKCGALSGSHIPAVRYNVDAIKLIQNILILSYRANYKYLRHHSEHWGVCSCKLNAFVCTVCTHAPKPYKQAPTHPWQKSKFLSCCCGTKQQKQVSLVSINCQRSSCWILALYYSWRGCASCWQLGAMFISSTLCCHKHDGFQAFILKDVFSDSFFPLLPFMIQLCCYPNNCYSISIYFFVARSRGVIKQYQVTYWVRII